MQEDTHTYNTTHTPKKTQLHEEYANSMRIMKMHLDIADAAPGTPAAADAMAQVINQVQHVCVVFMAGAMHNPMVIKRLLAAHGLATPWRAIEQDSVNLVELMKGCVVCGGVFDYCGWMCELRGMY